MAEISHPAEGLSQANESQSEAKVFEVGFHIIPSVAQEEVAGVVDRIRASLTKGGAEIIKEEFPARRSLAYMIERASQGKREKYTESYFGFIKFATSAEAVEQFKEELRA